MDTVTVWRLGIIPYEEGMRWQERLAQARQREEVGDCLLLLQHPPVITVAGGTQ